MENGTDLPVAERCLRQYLTAHGFARTGICTAGHCADVYIDQSPAADAVSAR
ncbi:hypothetical protein [Streptomyces cellulosae]|uniref:Uncharacterized protein n=1 Tax=Streptomyces cellulosae TaxID=1968 RepID=A0ABW7Y538_STRCE